MNKPLTFSNNNNDLTISIIPQHATIKRSAIQHEECRWGANLLFLRPWARRWINHWSLWCMASAMQDLQLPPQPQDITAPWPVPNYTACWQEARAWTTCPRFLPKSGMADIRTSALLRGKSNALTTMPHSLQGFKPTPGRPTLAETDLRTDTVYTFKDYQYCHVLCRLTLLPCCATYFIVTHTIHFLAFLILQCRHKRCPIT